MTRKSSNRSRGRKARSGKSASSSKLQIWLGRIWSIGWKLALTLAAVLVFNWYLSRFDDQTAL